MKKKECEFLIKKLEQGNPNDLYRPSSDLSILLRLMLHCHLKPNQIYKMTVHDFYSRQIAISDGTLPIKKDKRGLPIPIVKISRKDYSIIKKHIQKKNLSPDDKLITVDQRSLRYKFENLASVYYEKDKRPEMVQFYYVGLGIEDYKPMKRPPK